MLEVKDLTKKYGKTLAADHIGFTVPDGKIGILLGPNGAGKSTVIKSIAGLLRYKGSIRIQGQDAGSLEAKRQFAYVPELPYMYDALTVREHIEFITRAYGVNVTDEQVERLFERFELTDKQEKLGNELSKGMMQKVSICCALVIMPKVILLDEPMVGLDPAAIKELKEVILELKADGCTVLISTHMLEMVKELWDVTFVMDKGHIIGTYPRETVADEDLEALYFAVTGHGGDSGQAQGESKGGDSWQTQGESKGGDSWQAQGEAKGGDSWQAQGEAEGGDSWQAQGEAKGGDSWQAQGEAKGGNSWQVQGAVKGGDVQEPAENGKDVR